jgi:hypothetical protein
LQGRRERFSPSSFRGFSPVGPLKLFLHRGFTIDLLVSSAGECVAMNRFSACVAVVAMLFALVSAPLFHVHEADDHGHAGSIVHAHFPGLEHASSTSEKAIETQDSHNHVRWLDVFTLAAPIDAGVQAVAEFSAPLMVAPRPVSRAVVMLLSLRTHSPPERSKSAPRSPPAI